ncbi:carbohydrate kinase family protein [Corynebacterium epidermidicanis]|uniref:Fructose-1-phosphate kinase/fructose-6-phosphate kinase n=1 Tax=Corynebacterium epidermidicanis TaxID=1050174 RepID=A0A0G3GUW8_9CORY|nr:hypothetical protein [Corynebacterium epidermidicanis]AKK03328.1 fructose-1-phosphate kinase/fructose-6-phosphate kinase [Corynebacterium epidermidicanis]
MIVTITPTPSLDRTAHSDGITHSDDYHQLTDVYIAPAGGGMNISRVLYLAGQETLAIVPAPDVSQYMRMVGMFGIPCDNIDVPGPIPVHFKVHTPSGQLLEFRDPPMPLDVAQLTMLRDHAVTHAENASWVVLAGQLPSVANSAWFVDVMRAIRLYHPGTKIAVATAGQALSAVLRQVFTTKPDVIALDAEHISINQDVREVVATLIDAEVQHILLCKRRNHFELISGGTSFEATIDSKGTDRLPWIDTALAGLLLVDPDHDPAGALRHSLAYANSPLATQADHAPTPDSLMLNLVRMKA